MNQAVTPNDPLALCLARQEIEYLRRAYARATDLIGLGTEDGIRRGREIYRRIFTPDARIRVTIGGDTVMRAQGPDEWVEQAREALAQYTATQHLIGTQMVEVQQLPGEGREGAATMTSYLQAWHDNAGRHFDIFIGTYHDQVRYVPGVGWQIHDMELEKVSGEVRTY